MIVLGGGVVHKNRYLLDLIKNNVEKYTLSVSARQTKIVISELEDAPLRGALLLS
jgi:predicted NBD/HSP70 family sugar kinase